LQDLPETKYSDITKEEDLNYRLYSKYVIKLRKHQAFMDPNLPSPIEEYPEFKVEARKEKDRVPKLQSMIKKLKKEKDFVEQWNSKQQEKIQDFKRKRKEQKELLKEVRESNIRLYWHNVVLTTKIKQRDIRATTVIIP